jgi:hypothetical protein
VLLSLGVVTLTLVGVVGSHDWSGPDVLQITSDHGVHLLDLFVLAAGAVALLACWWAKIPVLARGASERRR